MPRPTPFIINPLKDFLTRHPILPELARRLAQVYESRATPVEDTQLRAVGTALPWETLFHPGQKRFIGRSPGYTLSRHIPELQPTLPEPEQGPLRVLLFTSLPDTLTEDERLDVEAEQAAVQEALLEKEQQGEVILEMPDDGRFDTFPMSSACGNRSWTEPGSGSPTPC